MTSIARAAARFKDNPGEHLDDRLVHEACVAAGHAWRGRKGVRNLKWVNEAEQGS